jgi:ubiquinone/menaquinone biosynthesis C-methylase UbiE
MQRVDAPEILDSADCPPEEVAATLKTLDRINLCFGGVTTTQKMVERVSSATGTKNLSLLEVAAGSGKVPEMVAQRLAHRGIALDITLLDRLPSHLPPNERHSKNTNGQTPRSLAADALALPLAAETFDLVSCNLFAHHLNPQELAQFMRESLRVCRRALLINDLVRHPLHLALVYASYPIMGSQVAWLDGLTSVRRAYTPSEICIVASNICPRAPVEISRHYLFRMGVIVWKNHERAVPPILP